MAVISSLRRMTAICRRLLKGQLAWFRNLGQRGREHDRERLASGRSPAISASHADALTSLSAPAEPGPYAGGGALEEQTRSLGAFIRTSDFSEETLPPLRTARREKESPQSWKLPAECGSGAVTEGRRGVPWAGRIGTLGSDSSPTLRPSSSCQDGAGRFPGWSRTRGRRKLYGEVGLSGKRGWGGWGGNGGRGVGAEPFLG